MNGGTPQSGEAICAGTNPSEAPRPRVASEPVPPRCPRCHTSLAPVGALWLCLDCAWSEPLLQPAPPPPAPEAPPTAASSATEAETPPAPRVEEEESPTEEPFFPPRRETAEHDEEPTPPSVWLPPRRQRGGVMTALGFQAGHSCPRVCGGVLEEVDGSLRCTACDFRSSRLVSAPRTPAAPTFSCIPAEEIEEKELLQEEAIPEAEADDERLPPEVPPAPEYAETTPAVASDRVEVPAIETLPAQQAELTALQAENARLQDENARLLQRIYDLMRLGDLQPPPPPITRPDAPSRRSLWRLPRRRR